MRHPVARAALGLALALATASPLASQRPDFALVDSVALHVPAAVDKDLPGLVRHLVAPARDDRERARAIYRWITANIEYDVDRYFSGSRAPAGDPFVTRRAVCFGYSELFERMARLAGLQVASVMGYSKGYEYRPGKRFSETNHSWNAVRIDGRWELLDATWGAGPVDGRRFVREFEEYWFLTPPEEFVFTHLPEDRRWQLQAKRLSLGQWEKQVYVTHPFFKVGFSVDSLRQESQRKGFGGPPSAFSPRNGRLSIVRAPLTGALAPGSAPFFQISAPRDAEVVVVSGGKWHALDRSGDLVQGTVRAEPGEMLVQVRFRQQDPYSVVLVYRVAG